VGVHTDTEEVSQRFLDLVFADQALFDLAFASIEEAWDAEPPDGPVATAAYPSRQPRRRFAPITCCSTSGRSEAAPGPCWQHCTARSPPRANL
jgi:hypothetical protein